MLKDHRPHQTEIEMVTLEDLVPTEHLVRQIENAIDFEFIRSKVRHLYCTDNGRPAIDPVMLFKIILLGYLFGIRSERQLMREIQVNNAYRWFLRLRLSDKVPDASTLSQNRRRRFSDSHVYQDIFDEIVVQAMNKGLIDGHALYTDSTHLKANANKNKFEPIQVQQSTADYLAELDKAVDTERAERGKKPLKRDDDPSNPEPDTRTIKQSTTDPDSGYMVRDDKPKGFFYLDHRTVDGKHAIIVDTHATAGNVADSSPYLSRLDRVIQRFGLKPWWVGLDAGYYSAPICHGIEQRGINAVMGYRRPSHKEGYFYKRQYSYDAIADTYTCPKGKSSRMSIPTVWVIANTVPIKPIAKSAPVEPSAPKVPIAPKCSLGTSGVMRKIESTHADSPTWASGCMHGARKRLNAVSPMPSNYTDIDMPVCGELPKSLSSA